MNKLFTTDGKPLLFNLIGFDHREFFELARKIEQNGGQVSLLDNFNSQGITIVNPNNCYSFQYIKDSIDNSSLVDLANYCLSNVLKNVTETNKNNSIADDLSLNTTNPDNFDDETDEEHQQSNGLFAKDHCLEESPDLLNMGNDIADEETDEESYRNSTVMSDQTVDEEVDERRSHSPVTEANSEKVSKNIDNDLIINRNSPISVTSQSDTEDDIVPNSDGDTIKKYKSYKNKKKFRSNRTDLSSDESSDGHMFKKSKETDNSSDSSDHLRKTKKRKKQSRSSSVSSASDVNLKHKQSSKKKIVVMNKIVHSATPPTSDDESINFNHTNKVSPKKHPLINNGLISNVHTKTSQPKESTNEELIVILNDDSDVNNFLNEENQPQKATSATKTELDVKKERFQKFKSNTETNHTDDSNDNSDNTFVDPIVASRTKWLKDHISIEAKIMNKLPGGNRYRYYQAWEEQGMLWWLIKNNKIDVAKNPTTWKELIKAGCLPHRTWKGLYNHFHRRMIKKLSIFKLPDDIYRQLNASYK